MVSNNLCAPINAAHQVQRQGGYVLAQDIPARPHCGDLLGGLRFDLRSFAFGNGATRAKATAALGNFYLARSGNRCRRANTVNFSDGLRACPVPFASHCILSGGAEGANSTTQTFADFGGAWRTLAELGENIFFAVKFGFSYSQRRQSDSAMT